MQNNKKLIDEGMKRYYQENREERLLYGKQYRKNNPDKIRESARVWEATPAAKKWRTEYKIVRKFEPFFFVNQYSIIN